MIYGGMLMAFLLGLMPGTISAQTGSGLYQQQIDALKQSFEEKKLDPLQAYISPELKFRSYPPAASAQILGQVFARFPKLNSLEVLEEKNGEVMLRYDFTGLGKRESAVLFDADGKVKELQLIENILIEQEEAQRALASQKQAPTPGPLSEKYPGKAISFKSPDGLEVSAMLYEVGANAPVILLCHQAGYNKYEYADIAPKLNEMGYNALAIDQRSGGPFAGKENETFLKVKDKSPEMVDAQQDIEAAVNYLAKKYNRKVILWGSSYSSSLALFVGAENESVRSVIAFSPGDYFGEARPSLSGILPKLDKPFFITSSKQEAAGIKELLKESTLEQGQIHFIPEGSGYHGSRALWEGQKGGAEYWEAITGFLKSIGH
jgi:dienelactone hydrolase